MQDFVGMVTNDHTFYLRIGKKLKKNDFYKKRDNTNINKSVINIIKLTIFVK